MSKGDQHQQQGEVSMAEEQGPQHQPFDKLSHDEMVSHLKSWHQHIKVWTKDSKAMLTSKHTEAHEPSRNGLTAAFRPHHHGVVELAAQFQPLQRGGPAQPAVQVQLFGSLSQSEMVAHCREYHPNTSKHTEAHEPSRNGLTAAAYTKASKATLSDMHDTWHSTPYNREQPTFVPHVHVRSPGFPSSTSSGFPLEDIPKGNVRLPKNKGIGASLGMDDLRSIIEGLESVTDAVTGFGDLLDAEIVIEVDGTKINAAYINAEWNLAFR